MKESTIEQTNQEKIISFLKSKLISSGFIHKGEEIWIKEIKNNVFGIGNKNIWFYENKDGELILDIISIIKSLGQEKYSKYLKKLGYKEIKDSIGHYHMINLKNGKEVNQTSYEYYKLFEILGNIQYREYLSDVIYQNGLKKEGEKLKKMPNLQEQMDEVIFSELESMVRFNVLKPIELLLFFQYGIINKEHFNKLKDKVYSFEYIKKLIENPVWNYVEGRTKEYKINGKTYKIETNGITEDELNLYLDLKIINKEEYELLKDILEKEILEKEKKEHIEKTKEHLSSLEDDVTSHLA